MKIEDKNLFRDVRKAIVVIIGIMFLCRITAGGFGWVLALCGISWALANKSGLALACFAFFPFLVIFNPLILPLNSVFVMAIRSGTPLMTLCLMLSASRRSGNHQLPFMAMIPFLCVAIISSIQGYFPMISYLKIVNFAVFFFGIFFATKNIQHRPQEVHMVRVLFLAIATILILGSLLTLAYPAMAYYVTTKRTIMKEGMEAAAAMLQQHTGVALFCGITNQSQFLAPMISCVTGWVLCDMLAVERRITPLHMTLVAVAPILLYLTRSRAGLVSFCVMCIMVLLYAVPRLKVSRKVRSKMNGFLYMGLCLIFIAAIVAEYRSSAMTKWVRKTNSLETDARTATEAFTNSRMGLVEMNLRDFHRNPMWGSGFQVSEDHPMLYQMGAISLFSASIEKGLLPLMVIGETGVAGAIAFSVFLLVFFGTCIRKKYFVTVSLFVVYLSTNMAESTFFSPGGGGGPMWIMTVIGGFVIDTVCLIRRNEENRFAIRQY